MIDVALINPPCAWSLGSGNPAYADFLHNYWPFDYAQGGASNSYLQNADEVAQVKACCYPNAP